MRKKTGIIYCLSNELWGTILKCGLTSQQIKKRVSNIQTSLFIDCKIELQTDTLINCEFYEYLLKKFLCDYRVRNDREFFNTDVDVIKEIFETFNYVNQILNTECKLNEYAKNNHPEYYRLSKKRKYIKIESSSSDKPKRKRRRLFVDTSY